MQIHSTSLLVRLLLFLLFAPFQSFNQPVNAPGNNAPKNEGFLLRGHIKGLAAGTKVFIRYEGEREDSVIAKEAYFQMEGKVAEPSRVYILIKQPDFKYTSLWIENSTIDLTGHIDSLREVTVKGSQVQEQYAEFLEQDKKLAYKADSLKKALVAVKGPKDSVAGTMLQKAWAAATNDHRAYKINFIKENPGSVISVDILRFLKFELERSQVEELFNTLETEVKKTANGKQLESYLSLFANPQIGSKAPGFIAEDLAGNKVSLDQFKGKYVLLDFWGTWCAPCLHEMPNLVKAYQEYRDKGFEIVAVAADLNKDILVKTVKEYKMTWTNISELKGDQDKVILMYGVSAFPDNFLIDPNGIIIGRNLRATALQARLTEIFNR